MPKKIILDVGDDLWRHIKNEKKKKKHKNLNETTNEVLRRGLFGNY
jgi:hypothetical protein